LAAALKPAKYSVLLKPTREGQYSFKWAAGWI
jgi:hypothetical protein